MSLERMTKGPPFPNDVIDDDNLYQYDPSNLPVEFWFYVRPDQKKDSEQGSWKAKGEPTEIFSNSSVTGLRTTLEFYEGQAPHAQRTNWVMQEYSIIQKGLPSSKNLKGSNLLCRVFLTSGAIENEKLHQKLDSAENVGSSYFRPKPSGVPDTGNSLGLRVSQARSWGENHVPLGVVNEQQLNQNQAGNLFETDCIAQGDYLEMDDLLNSGSQSSRSDNFSCVTISSDECFDSLALLNDLENEINKGEEGKRANIKRSVAASAKPNEVVLQPVASGSLIGSSNLRDSPNEAMEKRARDKRVSENALKAQNMKTGNRNESKSNSEYQVASSSSDESVPEGKKKRSGGRLKKLNKKYLCFMPF